MGTLWVPKGSTVLQAALNLHSCMGICYAKLFEAAKSLFKSLDSRAV